MQIKLKNGLELTFRDKVDKDVAQAFADMIDFKFPKHKVEQIKNEAVEEAVKDLIGSYSLK